jgi:hypothetical protein
MRSGGSASVVSISRREGAVTVTFDLTPKGAEVMDELAKATGQSWDAILGIAIGLLKDVRDAKAAGKAVGVAKDGGVLEREYVGI